MTESKTRNFGGERRADGSVAIHGVVGPLEKEALRQIFGVAPEECERQQTRLDGSMDSVAQRLGKAVVKPGFSSLASISGEERVIFGGLDDRLIRRAQFELIHFVPDNFSFNLAQCLAAATLQAMSASPTMEYGEVLDIIAKSEILAAGSELNRADVMICAGVLAITHDVGRQYFAEQPQTSV